MGWTVGRSKVKLTRTEKICSKNQSSNFKLQSVYGRKKSIYTNHYKCKWTKALLHNEKGDIFFKRYMRDKTIFLASIVAKTSTSPVKVVYFYSNYCVINVRSVLCLILLFSVCHCWPQWPEDWQKGVILRFISQLQMKMFIKKTIKPRQITEPILNTWICFHISTIITESLWFL